MRLAHADADAWSIQARIASRHRFTRSVWPTSSSRYSHQIIDHPTNQCRYQTSKSRAISFRYPSNQQLATRGTTPGYNQAPAESSVRGVPDWLTDWQSCQVMSSWIWSQQITATFIPLHSSNFVLFLSASSNTQIPVIYQSLASFFVSHVAATLW